MNQPNSPNPPMNMTPKRPYLLRACYEWIVDNGMTPHIMVDARSAQVSVPRQFVKDGSIVLNVSMTAANNLMMDNDKVTFSARFGGKAVSIWLPMWSIMAIYSRETQDGLHFSPDEYGESADAPPVEASKSRPSLMAVASSSDDEAATGQDDDPEPPPTSPPAKRPSFLSVVK